MDRGTQGWLCGFTGVLIFSSSLPATRAALQDFDPIFLTAARASIAGLLALLLLIGLRARLPRRRDLVSLATIAAGVVIGFPLLTALALRHSSAAHAMIFTGLLPLATAIFATLRGGERPDRRFWYFAAAGSACVMAYAVCQGAVSLVRSDWLMVAAILVCGLGYAEGGLLARRLGGWQVICWALVLALPAMIAALSWIDKPHWDEIGVRSLVGLAYVSLFSMLIGFMFWYRGLALGGSAAVGQVQLLQPLLGLLVAASLLHEHIETGTIAAALAVLCCVAGARHFSVRAAA